MPSPQKTNVSFLRDGHNTELVSARFGNHRFPVHFHDTFVIQLVTKGVDWCSSNDMAATKNELFVHLPYASHTGGNLNGHDLEYRAVYPSVATFCELTGTQQSEVPTGYSAVFKEQAAVQIATRLFSSCEQAVQPEKRVRQFLKQIFEIILHNFDAEQAKEDSPQPHKSITRKMFEIRSYLAANHYRDISIAELGEHSGLSRYHLIRAFKLHFGITPRQFLISQRVATAKSLIASGISIADAACRTGFADQSHLTRNFKRITSYNPGALQN